MIVEYTYCRPRGYGQHTKGYIEVPAGSSPVEVAKAEIKRLDRELTTFSTGHLLVGAKEYTPPNPARPSVHDWQPRSPVTLKDSAGRYHNMRCEKCGVTGRRYEHSLIGIVRLDPHYSAKRFEDCRRAKKYFKVDD